MKIVRRSQTKRIQGWDSASSQHAALSRPLTNELCWPIQNSFKFWLLTRLTTPRQKQNVGRDLQFSIQFHTTRKKKSGTKALIPWSKSPGLWSICAHPAIVASPERTKQFFVSTHLDHQFSEYNRPSNARLGYSLAHSTCVHSVAFGLECAFLHAGKITRCSSIRCSWKNQHHCHDRSVCESARFSAQLFGGQRNTLFIVPPIHNINDAHVVLLAPQFCYHAHKASYFKILFCSNLKRFSMETFLRVPGRFSILSQWKRFCEFQTDFPYCLFPWIQSVWTMHFSFARVAHEWNDNCINCNARYWTCACKQKSLAPRFDAALNPTSTNGKMKT